MPRPLTNMGRQVVGAYLSKLPDPDSPLRNLVPSGGWIDREPTAYAVRARNAEEALTLAVYCHYVLQSKVPPKYAGRVARSHAELSGQPGLRTFGVLIGTKPGPKEGERRLTTEIIEYLEVRVASTGPGQRHL